MAPYNFDDGNIKYKQSGAFQRRAAVNHQLRWRFARGDGDLPLPKPVRNAIWPRNGRESGECGLITALAGSELTMPK